jgi:hypothetical protein
MDENNTASNATAPPPSTAASVNHHSNDPILARLKELEDSNNSNSKMLDQMQRELKEKEDRIKALSADKRKEMETILATAIDNWLNSLVGVSDENKANFREGICKLAERADMNNAAWEIICHASQKHKSNVDRIEELLLKTQQQEQEIGDLKGFRNEASRISGHKRARTDDPTPVGGSRFEGGGAIDTTTTTSTHHTLPQGSNPQNNTWDLFQSMITRDLKPQYF